MPPLCNLWPGTAIPYNYTSLADREIVIRLLGEAAWELLDDRDPARRRYGLHRLSGVTRRYRCGFAFRSGFARTKRAKPRPARPSNVKPSRAPPPPPVSAEAVTVKVTVVAGEVPAAFEQVRVNV